MTKNEAERRAHSIGQHLSTARAYKRSPASNFVISKMRRGTEPPHDVHSREDEAADAYGLGWLCLTTGMGLVSAGAAVFTWVLPLSIGLQYFSLSVCVATFLLSTIGLALFFRRPMKEDLHHGHR